MVKMRIGAFILMAALLLAPARPASAEDFRIDKVAGSGSAGYTGDGGLASSAQVSSPGHMVYDQLGNLYIADYGNNRVRKIAPNGTISTVAGTGAGSSTGDGGPATLATIAGPWALTLDSAGNLYIAEYDGNRIRKIDSSGNISTFVGTGTSGYSGDGGPAASAQLRTPYGITVAKDDSLYIADRQNHAIRRVASGIITTVAGNGSYGYTGDGGPASAAQVDQPTDVAFGPGGELYISELGNRVIRKVDLSNTITTVAGTGGLGSSGDGGPAASAQFNRLESLSVDASGQIYVTDSNNHTLRRIDNSGVINRVAGDGTGGNSGDGGIATNAKLNQPGGVAIASTGNVVISDFGAHVIRQVALLAPASAAIRVSTVVTAALNFSVSAQAGPCNGVAQTVDASSSGTAVGLGRINSSNGTAAQKLDVTTNAASGAIVYVRSSGPLTSNGHTIANVAANNASPAAFPALGTEAFGYTTSDSTLGLGTPDRFTSGGAKWAALSTMDSEVSFIPGPTVADSVCVAYQAGTSPATRAGSYSTTVIYTAVASF